MKRMLDQNSSFIVSSGGPHQVQCSQETNKVQHFVYFDTALRLRHRRLISSMWGKSNISEFRHLWVKDGAANLYSSRSSTRGLPYDKLDLVVKFLLAGQRLLKVPCHILPIQFISSTIPASVCRKYQEFLAMWDREKGVIC